VDRQKGVVGDMPEPAGVIHAPRLDLVLMSPPLIESMRAADWKTAGRLLGAEIPAEWQARDWHWLDDRTAQADADPSVIPWLPRIEVLRRPATAGGMPVVVGDVGFHGPPDDEGRAEIGYAVISEHRRRGFAEEAVRALLAWTAREVGVTRFSALIEPGNVASLSLIRKLGFDQTGVTGRERTTLLIFHRDGPPDGRLETGA
jgi:[ribosomal protein S5]-alanine N-acetyltransferase